MNLIKGLIFLAIIAVTGFGFYIFSANKSLILGPTSLVSVSPFPAGSSIVTPTYGVTSPGPSAASQTVSRLPRIVTELLPVGVYGLPTRETAILQLPFNDIEPSVTGTAILLIRLHTVSPSPNRKWELRAVQLGSVNLTLAGSTLQKTWRIVVEQ